MSRDVPHSNPELSIHLPDGQTKTYPLRGDRVALGRSSINELSFPEDAGLSRQHLILEKQGDGWIVQDLNSKNGTQVNEIPLRGKLQLKPGDRITAGHLTILMRDAGRTGVPTVEFFEPAEAASTNASTLITDLKGALSGQTIVEGPSPRRLTQVQALIQAGQQLAGSGNLPLPELFPLLLDLAVESVGGHRGVLMTLENDELSVKAKKGEGFRISSVVRDRVLNQGESILVRDSRLDTALRERVSIVEQMIWTLMAVPLQTGDRIIGLIYVDAPGFARAFTQEDLNLLTVIANTAAIRIEHARLAEVEEAERRLARELEQAAEIQRLYLPDRAPSIPGADLAGYNAPCRTVGGDYYDFFPYPDGRVGLALGDVSGKGMPASLMMMGLQARVQVLAEEPHDLASVMARLNKSTCLHCPSNRFVTFFFSVLNSVTGELAYCNAGHNPPLVIRGDGNVEHLEGGGPVLGILPVARYTAQQTSLGPGDVLVLYSDGVTEATNSKGEEFGEARLAEVLSQHRGQDAPGIVDAVNRAVAGWAGNAPAADDITLLVARRI